MTPRVNNISNIEEDLIKKIVERSIQLFPDIFRTEVYLYVRSTHLYCIRLDLEKLLNYEDKYFMHDISGILNYLDIDKLELKNCFVPRCASSEQNMSEESREILNDLRTGKSSKAVFKLDKNFHVYVHGNKDKFKVDEDKEGTFLKLYFNNIN
jgi:hypothetical protein